MIRVLMKRFIEALWDGFRIWWLAPLVPLLAVLPEFAQHVVEIQIGMFESRTAAVALAGDSTRMAFGAAKVAGLLLAIAAAVRFWATRGTGTPWYSLRGIRWGWLALAVALMIATSLPEWLLMGRVSPNVELAITLAITLITLPLITLFAGALIGDPALNLRRAFTHGWWPALRMVLFAAVTWIPLFVLHGLNHDWAFGAPDAVVWALMVFDSLVVGLLAVMAGTAFHHGYALPTQRGTGFTSA